VDAHGVPMCVVTPFVHADRNVGRSLPELRHATLRRVVAYSCAFALLIFIFALPGAFTPAGSGSLAVALSYAVFALPIAIVLAQVVVERRHNTPGFATFRLMRGLCASCGYAINAVTPGVDGCTVCPECGAAWRLPPPPANNLA
jgi:hypothetical protein